MQLLSWRLSPCRYADDSASDQTGDIAYNINMSVETIAELRRCKCGFDTVVVARTASQAQFRGLASA